ncbi:MAG: DUF1461 domain-containing protein [Clostridia bacterium]|nr:DUF1461 domain-containing protein [Clostridia bacterium]
MKRALYAAGTAACLLLLLAAIVCFAAARMGRDGALYARCFHAFANTGRFGVPEEAYDGIGQTLGDYFSGMDVDFPYFNQRERTHLSDIRGLFSLMDRGWLLLIPAVLLACALARRPDAGGFMRGLGLTALALGLLAAYIAFDFEDAFILMHRLLFKNDLWLLNPNTDLLICLMPEDMFMYLARLLALWVIPLWLLWPTLAVGIYLVRKGR